MWHFADITSFSYVFVYRFPLRCFYSYRIKVSQFYLLILIFFPIFGFLGSLLTSFSPNINNKIFWFKLMVDIYLDDVKCNTCILLVRRTYRMVRNMFKDRLIPNNPAKTYTRYCVNSLFEFFKLRTGE